MLSSMTGFVSKAVTIPLSPNENVQLTIAIKTLNSRFFEATCRLAPAISMMETDLIKQAKDMLHRGHMYLTMNLSNPNCFKSEVILSLPTVKGYVDALNTAQKKFNLSGSINVNDLLHIPGIFVTEDLPINDSLKQVIMDHFIQAMQTLQQTRSAEGASLLVDLKQRTRIMAEHIKAIEKAFQKIHNDVKKEVETKLETLRTAKQDATAMQDLALYEELDKIDIHEELVRFNTHLNSLNKLLDTQTEEKGRQLDFTLQELAREINTITSKCPYNPISTFAITIKVEIEKCREQAQNVV